MQIEEIAAHCARANTGMLHFLLHEVRHQSQWQTVEHSQLCSAVAYRSVAGPMTACCGQLGSKCASHDPWVEISLHYLQVGPVRTVRSAACRSVGLQWPFQPDPSGWSYRIESGLRTVR